MCLVRGKWPAKPSLAIDSNLLEKILSVQQASSEFGQVDENRIPWLSIKVVVRTQSKRCSSKQCSIVNPYGLDP